jgi:hypothetical protein
MLRKSQTVRKAKAATKADAIPTRSTAERLKLPEKLESFSGAWAVKLGPAENGVFNVNQTTRTITTTDKEPTVGHLMYLAMLAGQVDVMHYQGNQYINHALRIDAGLNELQMDLEDLISLIPGDLQDVDQRQAMEAISEARTAVMSMIHSFNSHPKIYTAENYRATEARNEAEGMPSHKAIMAKAAGIIRAKGGAQ